MSSNKLTQLLLYYLIPAVLLFYSINAKKGFGPGEQDWGHIEVRHGAHMFYWLYYTTDTNIKNYTERPLIIWLQGGPGASSTGYGNFEELGPLDLNLNNRNFTWIKHVNVLFIDNPVGTGFSYVENSKLYTKTNNEIALDLVKFMKEFYKLHPEFQSIPLHIFSESYGGKMASEFALELYQANKKNLIKTNLKSVSLGNSWISPIDSVNSWAPLLLNMGIVDYDGYYAIQDAAKNVDNALKKGLYKLATVQWGMTQQVLNTKSENIDFYNILSKIQKYRNNTLRKQEDIHDIMYKTLVKYDCSEIDSETNSKFYSLDSLMRNQVSKALSIPKHIVWGSQSNAVFSHLNEDFMKPVIHIVEKLLNSTNIDVIVYSGQLDLICATPGTVNWIKKMNDSIKAIKDYKSTKRNGYSVNGIIEGFVKKIGKFSMYWVNRAGHMVPNDNPIAMDYILKSVTN